MIVKGGSAIGEGGRKRGLWCGQIQVRSGRRDGFFSRLQEFFFPFSTWVYRKESAYVSHDIRKGRSFAFSGEVSVPWLTRISLYIWFSLISTAIYGVIFALKPSFFGYFGDPDNMPHALVKAMHGTVVPSIHQKVLKSDSSHLSLAIESIQQTT